MLLKAALLLSALPILVILRRRRAASLFGPVLIHDLIRSSRRQRLFLLRSLYALAICGFVVWFGLVFYFDAPHYISSGRRVALLAEVFAWLTLGFQFAAVVLLTPLCTAGAIAEEKERKTLEFLLATDLGNGEIVLGKVVSRLAGLTLILLTGLPIFSLGMLLGGIDPGLILAGFAVTLLTMASLAALSVLCSVYSRRSIGAMMLVYVIVAVYVALSLAGFGVYLAFCDRRVVASVAEWGIDAVPIRDALEEVNEVFGAGNIALAFSRGLATRTAPLNILFELVRDYAIFHFLVAGVCLAWAIARVRAVARKQAEGRLRTSSAGESASDRLSKFLKWLEGKRAHELRPPIGDAPVFWKETYVGGGFSFSRFTSWVFVVLACLPPLVVQGIHFTGLEEPLRLRLSQDDRLLFCNLWPRVLGLGLGSLLLVYIALRSAAAISGERARQTLDDLLLTTMDRKRILFEKAAGILWSCRIGLISCCLIWAAGVATGGIHPLALLALLLAWLVYAGFLTMLGLWFSISRRTTLTATLFTMMATVLVAVGHWALFLVYGFHFLIFGGGSEDRIQELAAMHSALTSPFTLFLLGFRSPNPATLYRDEPDHFALPMASTSLLGLFLLATAAVVLWRASAARFRRMADPASDMTPTTEAAGGAVRKPRTSRLKRRLKWAGGTLLLLTVAMAATWYISLLKGEQRLRRVLAETDALDPGWRVEDLEARRPAVADEDNSALVVKAIAERLPNPWPPLSPSLAGASNGQPGKTLSMIILAHPPEVQLPAWQAAELRADMALASTAYDRAPRLASMPRGRFPKDWTRQLETIGIPHLRKMLNVSIFLSLAAAYQAQEGVADEALALCRAQLNAARSVGDEPSFRSQSLRERQRIATVATIERVLAQGQPSLRQLEATQKLLEEEESYPWLLVGLCGERARLHDFLRAAGERKFFIPNNAPPGYAIWFNGLAELSGKHLHAEVIEIMNRLEQSAREPISTRHHWRDNLYREQDGASFLAQLLVRNSADLWQPVEHGRAELRCAIAALACERYRLAHGRWPQRLDVLVPNYLPHVPTDPYDGKPLHFRRTARGLVIYSVGEDGSDNNGKVDRTQIWSWSIDWGFRLWDTTRRRQPAPSRPKP